MAANLIQNGWFSEINEQWPGVALSLEIEEMLYDEKSKYQHIQVFKSKTFGNVLILDGVVQLTTRDECAYQEMIAHLPLFSHPNPENVLIIGGGDGGVIREVVKHSTVKHITICEIDQLVIEAGKKYFPSVASAWDDERVTLVCGDANDYIQKAEVEGKFDVIITDSSDPVGPAKALFESPFYVAMDKALKAGGKICTQAESMWLHLDIIKKLVNFTSRTFKNCEYATTSIPTYPCGQIGFLLCSKAGGKSKNSCATPARRVKRGEEDNFKYYTSELHSAAFVLPGFVTKAVADAKAEADAEFKEFTKAQKAANGKKHKADETESKEDAAAESVASPSKKAKAS